MSSTTQRTTSIVWPTLSYRDAPAAIRFLVEAFGFEESAVYHGDTEDIVVHAELRWPTGGGIMLGSAGDRAGDSAGDRAGDTESARVDLPAGTGSVYIVTDEPDALYERAVTAGATVVRAPRDEDYGSRDFIVRDPEGVFWCFGTYVGA